MKTYELMTIYKIDLGEEKAKALSQEIKDLIASFGGSVISNDFWGKRKFAYEIKHDSEGFYEVVNFEIEPSKIFLFKKKLNLVNNLVRYLVTAKS